MGRPSLTECAEALDTQREPALPVASELNNGHPDRRWLLAGAKTAGRKLAERKRQARGTNRSKRWAWVLALVFLSLPGCGRGIDPGLADRGEFEKFFQRYLVYAKERGVDTTGNGALRIEFADLESTEVGRCETGFLQGRIVYIDESRWKSMTEGSREALILHELGHCLLERGHRNDKFPAEDPTMPNLQKSLMYPYATSGTRYEAHKQYYLDELFTPPGDTRSVAVEETHDHGPCAGCHANPEAALSASP